jgi:bifunctional UDP-N-acetylglucosamine pyrophosphorylase / glucosamine-1-phosphate N-acetyltransferase
VPNSERVLIIPAAGAGTRLHSAAPKVLTPVNGRVMVDYLFDLYRGSINRFVLVVHPTFEGAVREHCGLSAADLDIAYVSQAQPTGMLDAILLAADASGGASRIWITWCDQIGVSAQTVETLRRLSDEQPDAHVILPTVRQQRPYIHFARDSKERISAVLQRREGDPMPAVGESDMGLFSLSTDSYFNVLPRFGRETAEVSATGERNFLPFIPWSDERGHRVVTFPVAHEIEALGINTPDDLRRMEQHLAGRGPR